MANNNEEVMYLINQARAEARSEGLRRILTQNSRLITLLLIVVLLALSSWFGFGIYQDNQQEKYTKKLYQALIYQEKGEVEKTKKTLEEIYNSSSAPKGVKSLASLRLAAMLLENNQKPEALDIYLNVNDSRGYDQYIKELSGLLAVKILITNEDQSKDAENLVKINKIEANARLLKYYISEQKGILALQKNDLVEAKKIFESIAKNPEISNGLKNRAGEMLKIISAKIPLDMEEKKAEAK
jgi:hypothetical protein